MAALEGGPDSRQTKPFGPFLPSRPGEFHLEPLTEPDLTLSRHAARAAARRLQQLVVA
jgi:hypothetical protein